MKKQSILIYAASLLLISFAFKWFSSQFFLVLVFFSFIFFLLFIILWLLILKLAIQRKSRLSLIILILNLLILLFFPFNKVKLYVEFDLLKENRIEIISRVQSKDLTSYDSVGNIVLPSKFKYVSASGKVHLYKNEKDGMILGFWIYRGLMISSRSDILIYSTFDKEYIKNCNLISNIVRIEEVEKNWYYIVTN